MTNSPKICIHNLILVRIYSIIEFSRVLKTQIKGEWIYILNKKLKYCTKEILKYFNIIVIALGFIIAIILVKYKPVYKVSISGQEIGYAKSKNVEENIKENILQNTSKNIDTIDIKETPTYELKLVSRTTETNDEKISEKLEESTKVTYKYYDIALNNQTVQSVNTMEEAEELINQIKENNEEELSLSIIEKYTQNEQEISTTEIEIAKTDIQEKIEVKKAQIAEQARIDAMPDVNGIKLATRPVTGTITSRYGESSRLRSSAHTGLDIAASTGTPIKVVSDGTVTFAGNGRSYGNLVKISHGNGVETWYAHASKIYVKQGQQVKAEDVIAAVGSTGNSTGPHLHFEIRINGNVVNPQNYLY